MKSELDQELKMMEVALSSTKTKEALCENLPLLVIVCFKISLSSHVSLIEIVSSASSACLLSKVILAYIYQQTTATLGAFKNLIFSTMLGAFIYVTLTLITIFAIESERDGILVKSDPTLGSEDSSGLLFILLIFPTIFFCLIPFSIYDLIPFIFNDSVVIWEYFQEKPRKVWYISILLLTSALMFNLTCAAYFFNRDPIGLWDVMEPFFDKTNCQGDVLGLGVPSALCSQCNLKIGAGRIYLKFYLVFAVIVTMVAYLYAINYILGMRHRDRCRFKEGLDVVLEQNISYLLTNLLQTCSSKTLLEKCRLQLKKQEDLYARIGEKNEGRAHIESV